MTTNEPRILLQNLAIYFRIIVCRKLSPSRSRDLCLTNVSLLYSRFHPQPEGAIELESASIKNNVIYCKFRRDKLTVIQGRSYDLVNTPFHLLVAAGKDLRSMYITASSKCNCNSNNISYWQLLLIIKQKKRILPRIMLMLDLWRKFCTSLNKGWRNVSDFAKFAPRMF